jgi:hypothetical protein
MNHAFPAATDHTLHHVLIFAVYAAQSTRQEGTVETEELVQIFQMSGIYCGARALLTPCQLKLIHPDLNLRFDMCIVFTSPLTARRSW